MALVNCMECGKQFSNLAAACPNCAAPLAARANEAPASLWMKPEKVGSAQSGDPATSRAVRFTQCLIGICIALLIVSGLLHFATKLFPLIRDAGKPPLPIEIIWRKAVLGPSLVARVSNTSNRNLSLVGTFRNPTLRNERSFRIDVAPGSTRELGHLEGWGFASGDEIEIHHNDYADWRGQAP